ncbi:transporter substrate-binding domain-containing protein [Defluviimonas sp. WL0075]|uniref:Transporter substrate-binding domain-containing protein n=1 Tax=Albidovulum sediminicola TaxID=2984331 RepID=A0ABT2Z5E0_9RHOB|nr:transporter substrate-binding domain-containing protein [Defluviimonas sp. WL0075]MCV2866363.1 transporter substrate-binding domain-containing protein [Defluviimonas sp. WL0075]
MKFLQFMKVLVSAASFAVAAVATSATPVAGQSALEEVLQRGKLRVGMSTFVPWAMRDKEGNLIGFEIDVAKKVAADMGVEVEFVPTAWSGIIPALLAKKFDVIIGGMSITPERNLTVNFTIPYAHSGQQMASNKELAGGFTSLDDYNDASVTIACRRGATPCNYAQKRFPKATLRQFDDDAQAFQEVVNGNAHAMISSAPKPRFWADANPDKVFVANDGEYLTRGDEAFGIRKGDVDTLNFFSNWILVNTSNGWLQETNDYWFKDQSAWKDMVAAE